MRLNLPPTKTNQLALKKDLAMATEGYTLLEQKREILVMELMRLVDMVKKVQEEVENRREKAYGTLKRAIAFNGYDHMRNISTGIRYDHKITATTRVAAGIHLPSLEFQQGEFKSQYGLADTDSLVDQTMQDFLSLLEATAKLAELESSVWLLARELKKTQRHVNALEHIFIPDYKETLKYVEQALESKELESFFTMKRVKKNLGGEDGENPPDDSTNSSAEPSNPQV